MTWAVAWLLWGEGRGRGGNRDVWTSDSSACERRSAKLFSDPRTGSGSCSLTNTLLCPRPYIGGGIKRWCCLTSDACLSDVCRVHHEYSWCPPLVEARRAGRRRREACMSWSWAAACGVQGRGISCGVAHSLFSDKCWVENDTVMGNAVIPR